MSQHVSVKSTICPCMFFFSPSTTSTHKNGIYFKPYLIETHTHENPCHSLSLSLFHITVCYQWDPVAARLIHCTQSEGRPGQVSEVVLQQAIFLSLPKVSGCMADKSELKHTSWVGEYEVKDLGLEYVR